MALDSNNMSSNVNIFGKSDRNYMNKLRDSGLEYMSTSGKLIPGKIQPDIYCHCPQLCQRKLPKEKWKQLFREFYALADQNNQNLFLQTHIIIKTFHLQNLDASKDKIMIPNNKRRVTCKYHVPHLQDHENIEQFLEKISDNTIEICQKAFMNVFGITEKRVRMQRERCIALVAPDYFRKNAADRNLKPENRDLPKEDDQPSPMDLSMENSGQLDQDLEPLDLSTSSDRSPSPIEVDKTKLYELADMLGVPRSTVDREMVTKYEHLVRKNLAKQKKDLMRNKKKTEMKPMPGLKGISEQVVGLGENLAILPIQTVNNGDLTITPVLGPAPVENQDIMQVNSFFQNQLWRPEYIGLSSKTN